MSLKNKLNRIKPHLSIQQQEEKTPPQPIKDKSIPFIQEWEKENVFPYYLEEDYCLIREMTYSLSFRHGNYCFSDLFTAVELWNKNKVSHPLTAVGHHPRDLFFFDTETTGLGGGVGNTIFLLGYASIIDDKLILRQHILPYPGAEVALYQSFLERVNYKTLVTYNGKSFDWPQVKTRHTLVREHVPKLPEFGHFDLFHSAKRLWKHKLDRMKLSVVEKEVLGVERVDDIPGYLAPMIYFDFIESKRPEGMLGILKHNEIDILSLVTLYTHLTFQINGVDPHQSRPETYEVGRWFSSLGEETEAEKFLSPLLDGSDQTTYQAMITLAYQHKRNQQWEKAQELFQASSVSNDEKINLKACFELAKIYEHKFKDYTGAISYCEKAISYSKKLKEYHKLPRLLSVEELEFRLARLKRKWKKN